MLCFKWKLFCQVESVKAVYYITNLVGEPPFITIIRLYVYGKAELIFMSQCSGRMFSNRLACVDLLL